VPTGMVSCLQALYFRPWRLVRRRWRLHNW